MEQIIYIGIVVAQVVILIWYFVSRKAKANKAAERRETLAKEYPYEGMRNIALNTSPGGIMAQMAGDDARVYAVAMDWDMGVDIVTLVAQLTGDVNLYVQSGGGIIGAGKYPEVSFTAQKFTTLAQQYLAEARPASTTPLPQKNHVQFFLLTTKGKYTFADEYSNIEQGSSKFTQLFHEGQAVITEMRKSAFAQR